MALAGMAHGVTSDTSSEAEILASCLEYLAHAPRVAWACRMNVGAAKVADPSRSRGFRYVQFGFRGMSDIIGQMRCGAFLAIECKAPGGWPKPATLARWQSLPPVALSDHQARICAQAEFLALISTHGGFSGVAMSLLDCAAIVDPEPLQGA